MTEPVLAVDSLVKDFGRASRRSAPAPTRALDGVSLRLDAGDSLGVVGESGSGKTTLARVVTGLEPPTSGQVILAGAPVTRRGARAALARARLVQMVFQDPYASLSPHRTIAEMLDEIQTVHFERSRQERLTRTTELLESIGLGAAQGDARPRELSGGQRQRAAIARALIVEPRLLILDEAVSALDVSVQAQILNLLADLRARLGLTYLFITHDLGVVRQVTDQLLIMYRGRVLERGATLEVLEHPSNPYTQRLVASVPSRGMLLRRRRADLRQGDAA